MLSLLLSKKVRELRDYHARQIPDSDLAGRRPFQLTYEEVLDAHFAIADFFFREDYGLGGIGFRDLNGFLSTVDRQYSTYSEISDLEGFETISTLVFGIVKNHPFHDANKRTALLCLLLQLHRMGRVPTGREKNLEDFIVSIADNTIEQRAAIKSLKKKGAQRPTIEYISRYLQKNSRRTQPMNCRLRFRELRSILEANGFSCKNAYKGTIDIVRTESKRVPRFFRSDRIEKADVVVTNISYHGEGAEVADSTLKLVRQACGLTDQDGFDGEVLLRDAQPTFQLIKSYRTALQNLAYR